jgi:hypothetical protein
MDTNFSLLRRGAGLIWVGAALALPTLRTAAADTPANADAFPAMGNYVTVSGTLPSISGDRAAFNARTGSPATGVGGIEDLSYSEDLSNDSTLTINGHLLGGSDDYLGVFKITTTDVGSVEFGYKRFRTFYDGVGGFFPLADSFQQLSYEQLHVDRGSFWFNATLAKPNQPVFTLSFHADTRTGQKDSSEWGAIINPNAVIVNGALVGTALPVNTPYIAPNVLNLEEHHEVLEASMATTVGKVSNTLKASFDWVNNNDWRTYTKYPGSTVIVDPAVAVLDDQQLTTSTGFRVLDQADVKFSDKVALNVGLTYLHQSTTDGGQWTNPSYSTTLKQVYLAMYAAGIYGNAKVDDFVGNIFLKYTPTKNWFVNLGFRGESNVITSNGGFNVTSLATGATSTAASNFTVAQDVTYSRYADRISTPEVTIQYSGFRNLTLYGTFDSRTTHGDQHWVNPYAAVTTAGITGVVTTSAIPVGSVFFQDANQDYNNAKIGAIWGVTSMVTVRADVYRKDHQNEFIGSNAYAGTASYGAYYATGNNLTGGTVSVSFKPTPIWSFTTRYDTQSGMMSVNGNTVTGGLGNEITSGKLEAQTISESVDWTPYKQFYVHGDLSLAYNYLQTAYPVVTVNAANSIAVPFINANNNYVTASAITGFVLNKEANAEIQGYYSRANNYNPQVASGGQPYGADFEEQCVTAGVKYKFSKDLFAEAKVGYLRRTDATTGGFTNYKGPLAYVGLTYSL